MAAVHFPHHFALGIQHHQVDANRTDIHSHIESFRHNSNPPNERIISLDQVLLFIGSAGFQPVPLRTDLTPRRNSYKAAMAAGAG